MRRRRGPSALRADRKQLRWRGSVRYANQTIDDETVAWCHGVTVVTWSVMESRASVLHSHDRLVALVDTAQTLTVAEYGIPDFMANQNSQSAPKQADLSIV